MQIKYTIFYLGDKSAPTFDFHAAASHNIFARQVDKLACDETVDFSPDEAFQAWDIQLSIYKLLCLCLVW